ncbi:MULTISPECIES: TRAM domain-containing protein [Natrialbaceae]|uniref:TRAM domain-containing protein n=1 Tax=Natrialbaceae TaxID=1644061 RepID=UPI00207C1635|nr:RNA-binding protein [Natronococcus sp. CG52]
MLGVASLVLGGIVGLLFVSWLVGRIRGGGGEQRESYQRHRDAQQRDPPVEIGETETVAIEEFTTHHTGERHAVCKIEGFVVFVQDLPDDLEATDVIRVKILSFNRGHTSATATFLERP